MTIRNVSVVGLGYIGLPTAAVLARAGCAVVGVDVSPATVAAINRGEVHIIEPDLDDLVARMVREGRLRATMTPEPADAYLIAVPTPFKDDHQPDLSFVESACRSIAPVLRPGATVILESTSPVGATEQMARWIAECRPDLAIARPGDDAPCDIHIAYCPERVLPGNVIHELVANDRVIGGFTPACAASAAAVYQTFVKGACIHTDARTAEMCKLTENSFRDVNIAFANELSMICDRLGIDVWEMIALANRHPRVNILSPGPGVGGHCIAVDPWFIVHSAPEQAQLIRQARLVNDGKPAWVIGKVKAAATALARRRGRARRPVVACFGLAFKANIDDLRESPALDICTRLARSDAFEVLAVEPHIDTAPPVLNGLAELVTIDVALKRADIVLLLVDHAQFREVDPALLGGRKVIDTRGIWTGDADRRSGPPLALAA